MPLKRSEIHDILIVSLTNVGDVILTFPVLDILKEDFPAAKISLVVGPKADSLFNKNPHIQKVHVYDKHQPFTKTVRWVNDLRKERFDLIVDLRNSAIPYLTFPRNRTSFVVEKNKMLHMREKHCRRLRSVYPYQSEARNRYAVLVPEEDKVYVDKMLKEHIPSDQRFIVISAGAAHYEKRWKAKGFAALSEFLADEKYVKVVFVGDQNDFTYTEGIIGLTENKAVNLCGKTTLLQLAELMQRSLMTIANDSGPMHLASYLRIPVLAIFGPSNSLQYGPWSPQNVLIQKNKDCSVCQGQTKADEHTCMETILFEDVKRTFDIVNNKVVFRSA